MSAGGPHLPIVWLSPGRTNREIDVRISSPYALAYLMDPALQEEVKELLATWKGTTVTAASLDALTQSLCNVLRHRVPMLPRSITLATFNA